MSSLQAQVDWQVPKGIRIRCLVGRGRLGLELWAKGRATVTDQEGSSPLEMAAQFKPCKEFSSFRKWNGTLAGRRRQRQGLARKTGRSGRRGQSSGWSPRWAERPFQGSLSLITYLKNITGLKGQEGFMAL